MDRERKRERGGVVRLPQPAVCLKRRQQKTARSDVSKLGVTAVEEKEK